MVVDNSSSLENPSRWYRAEKSNLAELTRPRFGTRNYSFSLLDSMYSLSPTNCVTLADSYSQSISVALGPPLSRMESIDCTALVGLERHALIALTRSSRQLRGYRGEEGRYRERAGRHRAISNPLVPSHFEVPVLTTESYSPRPLTLDKEVGDRASTHHSTS